MNRAAVVAHQLAVGYGRRAVLSGIDLRLGTGITALVGRNGSGKSTLLKTLATVLPPKAGAVSVCGDDLRDRRSRTRARRRLGYVAQRASFPSNFTVHEMLQYSASIQHLSDPSKSVADVWELLGLDAFGRRQLGELSGGQRQRSFIAQALVHDPDIVLLDEPTAGLDIPARHEFGRILRTIGENRCVVISTHLVEDIVEMADELVLVNDRRAASVGSVGRLRSKSDASGETFEATLARMLEDGVP